MDGPKRYANYHGHARKNQVVGNNAARAPPAWKDQQAARRVAGAQVKVGSKIMLSMLPADVSEEEVRALFSKTVGPVQDAFIVYNNQAQSKGMAVVTFHKKEDAGLARRKYNGKIIDGRRPIKIEIVKDEDDQAGTVPPQPQAPTLLERMSPTTAIPRQQPQQPIRKKLVVPTTNAAPAVVTPRIAASNRKPRKKKGPKRVKKTAAQLDAEMEDYRTHVEPDVKA